MMTLKRVFMLWTMALLSDAAELQVDASEKALRNISNIYSVNTTGLILNHNRIMMNALDIQALRNYPKLTYLDLSYNLIAKLPDGAAFSGLESLETLRLTGNYLRTIKNETFADLKKLKTLDLGHNPWNCTQDLVELVKWMNKAGLQTGSNVTCTSPANLNGTRILDVLKPSTTTTRLPSVKSYTDTTTKIDSTSTKTVQSPSHPPQVMTTISSHNVTGKDTVIKAEQNKKPAATNAWKFLAGVVVIILCTSLVIVCAVKSPTWYKMLFDYRHQRLREAEEPSIFSTGRYSNFSLDTEQTETSAQELDQGLTEPGDDEDGFIEDGYIQPEDYKGNMDIDEV